MRNFVILLASVFTLSVAVAQDATTEPSVLKSKKGHAILPVAGEWGLGISANPFLEYAGNIFNGNTFNNEPSFTYAANPANSVAIFGKYVVDANTHYRVRFNIGINSTANKGIVRQDELTPDPLYPNYTQDWQKVSSKNIVLAAGYEKRRGATRLQGIYGGELVVGYFASKQTYEYGNSVQQDFTTPQTYSFGNNVIAGAFVGSNTFLASSRKTEQKSAPSFLVGARGFIGVEYFFAPRMSIGGEFGYMLAFRNDSKTTFTTEQWDAATNSVVTSKNDQLGNGGLTSVGIGLDNLSGSINLLLYF